VNNVIVEADSDFMGRRQAMQRPYLDLLASEYGSRMLITQLPLFADEIKGIERLKKLGTLLFAPDQERRSNP
jgi:anion-transporting  ArsA/GET3 family ATPase